MRCPNCGTDNVPTARFCPQCAVPLAGGSESASATATIRGPAKDPSPGLVSGKYRIVGPIGSGGMGIVYKADDVRLGRPVALKFLPPDLTRDPEARERFVQEARAASRIDHANICTIHEIDETGDGRTFIVMAYYEGESLKEKIGRGPLSVREAIDVAVQAAGGLSQAHRQGIVHRDIKPANIIITTDGVAKIVDFGLAKLADRLALTRAGTVMGTVAYMSPEQARGEDVDGRTDIWSLGVVLYEMLTGQPPFPGGGEQAVIYAILNTIPRPASAFNPAVPPDVDAVLGRALAKDPALRQGSAEELAAELERALAGGVGASPDIPGTAAAKDNSVAVISFQNISAGPEMDWLSDGIAETVTVDLKKVSSLSVVSREKVLQAQKDPASRKMSEESAIDLGRRLGVRWIVWGGFQRQAEALRLTAHFTDVATGNLAGSAKADGTMGDIFRLQDEIVTRLIGTLETEVSDSELRKIEKPETVEVKAYEFYVRGRQLLNRMAPEGIPKAVEYFREAIELDPRYALAYSGLGSILMIKYIAQTRREDLEQGISCLQAAIRHDPDIADPYLWLTYGYARDHRFEEAVRSGRRAVGLEPDNPLSHYFLGVAFMLQAALDYRTENYEPALEHFRINTRLQPNYQPAHMNAAWIFLLRGRYGEAEEALSRAVAIESSGKAVINRFVGSLTLMGNLCLRRGQLEEARSWYQRSLALLEGADHVYREPFQALTYCGLGSIHFDQGRYDEALLEFKRAEDLIAQHPRALGAGFFLLRSYLGQARAGFALGDFSESKKHYERAAALFRAKQGFDFNWIWEGCDAQVHYDLAGYFALLNRPDEALENLRRAVALGWRDAPAFQADPLFAALRLLPDFDEIARD